MVWSNNTKPKKSLFKTVVLSREDAIKRALTLTNMPKDFGMVLIITNGCIAHLPAN